VVDNTFAPHRCWCVRSNSAPTSRFTGVTKYLSGHGDVLGRASVVSDQEDSRPCAPVPASSVPVLGPFESYLTMRGIKTFSAAHGTPVRQCVPRAASAGCPCQGGARATSGRPGRTRRPAIRRLFPANLYGGMVKLEIRDAAERGFRFMDSLKAGCARHLLAMSAREMPPMMEPRSRARVHGAFRRLVR